MDAPDSAQAVDILQSLTPSQLQAVQHFQGPLLMLAGPGSGKTRVVTHRIAYLLQQGVAARNILALTFTNKAADEMRARLERLAPRQPIWMGTFHRFCARQLRQYSAFAGLDENYSIYDTDDSLKTLRLAIEDSELELVHYTPEQIARAISWAKSSLISSEDYQPRPGNPLGAIVAKIYPLYQRRLLQANAVDFDDLLLHVATMLRENSELRQSLDDRWRYIMVDEYQDTNLAQYAIVRALSIDHPNLAVTGDPDQSIYGWRGANLNNILDFERDYPDVQVVRLEQNYRSTKSILRIADHLISYNTQRKEKDLFTENAEGAPVRLTSYATHRDEADQIAENIAQEVGSGRRRPRDIAIFYRVNALSRSLEHALRERGVPYQIVSGLEFYKRKEIKDVLAYLHLIYNPRDNMALLRVINTPTRGIGKTTIQRLAEHARRYRISMLEAARECGLIETLNKRAAVAVARFVAMFDRLREVATEPLEEILGHVLTETSYREKLEAADTEEDQNRLANIEELLAAAREFDEKHAGQANLQQYLEETSLVNETDAWEFETDKVTLMTLHAAKGLEFPVVFIVGLEQGLLPHERSVKEDERVEEERRLLFVGITRAEEQLELSMSLYRASRGAMWPTVPSQFLMEMPRGEMQVVDPPPSFAARPWEDDDPQEEDLQEYLQDDPTPQANSFGASAKVTTAAEMLDGSDSTKTRLSPNAFHQGMLVTHPEYGAGTIVALSGRGPKRTATVRFFSADGQKKFRLAQSPLQPVQSPD